jgi:hypothetical protein
VFGNPTDVAELTPENATSIGRMLLEENTASVNHLHRERHEISGARYTYCQPHHTGWSLLLRVTDLAHGGVVAGEAGLGMR